MHGVPQSRAERIGMSGRIGEIQEVSVDKIKPYENNAKIHGEEQVKKIAESIKEFGFLTPCLIDKDYNLIAGHGRVMAVKRLGMDTVPCLFIEGLTEAQRRAYILADNKLTELGGWNLDIVFDEIQELKDMDFDVKLTGFEIPDSDSWFDRENRDETTQEGNDEYNEWLEKFEPKKTTDDCYTPDLVYDAVVEWVENEYGVDRKDFIRPFYPNGDYQAEDYNGKIVVDNPPFSILSEITRFYTDKGVRFFLFAPTLTLFSSASQMFTSLVAGARVTYENGAVVNTSFYTNMEDEYQFRTCPTLTKAVEDADEEVRGEKRKELPKYEYPAHVVSAPTIQRLSQLGIDFGVRKNEVYFIRSLDAQKEYGKAIYGGGYLISDNARVEREEAERKRVEREEAERKKEKQLKAMTWELSDRELEIIKTLG